MKQSNDGKSVEFVRIIVEDVMNNNPGSSFSPDDQMRLHKIIRNAMDMGYDTGVEDTVNRYKAISRKIEEEIA